MVIFKLRQGASIRANVGLLVCWSVGRSVRLSVEKTFGKEEKIKNQNSLIISDCLINFWHCWGDRVTTKINGRKLNNPIIKRIKSFDCFDCFDFLIIMSYFIEGP